MPPGRRKMELEAAMRSHVSAKTPGLSSGSARSQLCDEIVLLTLGLRRSILTVLTPSAAGPLALTLASWSCAKDSLRVWVHEPSRAVGILNVHRLAQLGAREQRKGAWIDASVGVEPGTLLSLPPSSSVSLVNSLCSLCKRIVEAEAGTHDNALVVLRGDTAEAGVGFVGWLLGYSAPYCLFKDSVVTEPSQALLVDAASYQIEDADQHWADATPNNLSNVPLLLFRVELRDLSNGRTSFLPLYAFSIPRAAAQAVWDVTEGGKTGNPPASSLCAYLERELQKLLNNAAQRIHEEHDDSELEKWLVHVVPNATCEDVCMPLVAL